MQFFFFFFLGGGGVNKVNYGLCENGELLFDVLVAVVIACVTDII